MKVAAQARQRAASCKQHPQDSQECKASYSCQGANDLANSLDEARTTLAAMQPRLADARKDTLKHFQTLEAEYVRQQGDDAKMQKAMAYSKFLSDFSKLMFDAASLADGVNSINDILKKLGDGQQISDAERKLLEFKLKDQAWELSSGMASSSDDVRTWAGGQGVIPPSVANAMTAKGAASDLFGAMTDFREKWEANPAVKGVSGKYSDAVRQKGLRASAKSLGQLAGKFLAAYSDQQQQELQDRLQENALNEGAIDKAAYDAYADYRRILQRELELEEALDQIRDAYQSAYACSAQCSGSLGPAPVPDTSALSYGEVFKKYNPTLAPAAHKINASASKFTVTPCDKKQAQKTSPPKELPPCEASGITGNIEAIAQRDAGKCK